eukprot:GHRR01012014.1.p1 GENE.GHRR01012014.1~~GHRR01012014.1.p1  ORF type:complete len:334 (+),score=146.54 GHRR01012014.1:288-1289(+)
MTMLLSIVPLLTGWPSSAVLLTSVDALLLLGVAVTSFFGQLLLTRGFQPQSAGKTAALNFSQVLYSYGFGIVLFGDHISWFGIMGIALIAVGMACSTAKTGPAQASNNSSSNATQLASTDMRVLSDSLKAKNSFLATAGSFQRLLAECKSSIAGNNGYDGLLGGIAGYVGSKLSRHSSKTGDAALQQYGGAAYSILQVEQQVGDKLGKLQLIPAVRNSSLDSTAAGLYAAMEVAQLHSNYQAVDQSQQHQQQQQWQLQQHFMSDDSVDSVSMLSGSVYNSTSSNVSDTLPVQQSASPPAQQAAQLKPVPAGAQLPTQQSVGPAKAIKYVQQQF